MTTTQIHEQVKAEFPGLERLAQKIFGISFVDLTPNLQQHVINKSVKSAAEETLATLKKTRMALLAAKERNLFATHYEQYFVESLIPEVDAVIAKAEGRV